MMFRILCLVLLLATYTVATEPSLAEFTSSNMGSPATVGVEMSQLFLRSNAPEKNARVYFGRGESSYSMGLNSLGEFSVATTQGSSSTTPVGDKTFDKDVLVVTPTHVAASNIIARSAAVNGLAINNVKQWQLVRDISFKKEGNLGWIKGEYFNCANLDLLTISKANEVVTATIRDLPLHEKLRITATVHFIDDWQGETAYMKMNGNYVWTESHELRNGAKALNVCGSDMFPETKFSIPVDFTIPTLGQEFTLEMGTTMEDGSLARFGISHLSIYTRNP